MHVFAFSLHFTSHLDVFAHDFLFLLDITESKIPHNLIVFGLLECVLKFTLDVWPSSACVNSSPQSWSLLTEYVGTKIFPYPSRALSDYSPQNKCLRYLFWSSAKKGVNVMPPLEILLLHFFLSTLKKKSARNKVSCLLPSDVYIPLCFQMSG